MPTAHKHSEPKGWRQTSASEWLEWFPRDDLSKLLMKIAHAVILTPPAEGNDCGVYSSFVLLMHGYRRYASLAFPPHNA